MIESFLCTDNQKFFLKSSLAGVKRNFDLRDACIDRDKLLGYFEVFLAVYAKGGDAGT